MRAGLSRRDRRSGRGGRVRHDGRVRDRVGGGLNGVRAGGLRRLLGLARTYNLPERHDIRHTRHIRCTRCTRDTHAIKQVVEFLLSPGHGVLDLSDETGVRLCRRARLNLVSQLGECALS